MRELLKAYTNGLDSRALDEVFEQWFRIINIAGEELTEQELRNARRPYSAVE